MTKSGALLSDLEGAAAERLDDAEALLRAGRYVAAIMSGIYALEIRLKVIICRRLDVQNLPKLFETHDLEALMLHAGLSQKIRDVKRPRAVAQYWDELRELSYELDQLRYRPPAATWNKKRASLVLHQLRDSPNGVLLWLEKQASIKSH